MKQRLRRRGVDHGVVRASLRETRWDAGEPVLLRGVLHAPRVASSMALMRRLREGDDLAHAARAPRGFRWVGVSQNVSDPLEMHKLQVSPAGLYVKVNWLSTHAGDGSLRLRFSYGAEILDDWLDDPRRAAATIRLVEGLFPECRLVTRGLAPLVRVFHGRTPRFIQPIVYSNAPGGGALFHHDYVPGQAGVLFTQFVGSTGWLTLPKRVLARHVQEHTGKWRDTRALLKRLDQRDAALERLINSTPSFTRRLAADGWFWALGPGDAILLPSPGEHDVAWHSVFTLGRGDNLALSVGFTSDRA